MPHARCSTSCSTWAGSCAFRVTALITAAHVTQLEQALDGFNDALPPLKEFILPGGGAGGGRLSPRSHHRAARRTARVDARPGGSVRPEVTQYLNRLSDLLFVLARVLARHERGAEVLWRHERSKAT